MTNNWEGISMKKVFNCRTFPKEDRIIFDKGKDHALITIEDKKHNKRVSICLNNDDVKKATDFLSGNIY